MIKKNFYLTLGIIGAFFLTSCFDNKGVNNSSEAKEGRISTHTRTNHITHQDLTEEETDLAKEHITKETAPGVTTVSIDAEGANMINESRKTNNCN